MSWFWWVFGVFMVFAFLAALSDQIELISSAKSRGGDVPDQRTRKVLKEAPPENAVDLQTRELLRRATDHKMQKQWAEAISCLRSAIDRMDSSPDFFGARDRVRLPQYIHLSGDFDGAWVEFNLLLAKLDVVNYLRFCRRGATEAKTLRMDEKALVLEKMIAAAKRAKRQDLKELAEQQLEQMHAPMMAAKSLARLTRMRTDIQKFRRLDSRLFPRIRWVASKGVRCQEACAALDGKTWAVDDSALDAEVEGHYKVPIQSCGCMLMAQR